MTKPNIVLLLIFFSGSLIVPAPTVEDSKPVKAHNVVAAAKGKVFIPFAFGIIGVIFATLKWIAANIMKNINTKNLNTVITVSKLAASLAPLIFKKVNIHNIALLNKSALNPLFKAGIK